ncbi:hypothetical protein [Rhodococcus sp. PSBB049]|uniref:hypothetical protein n=1 Tax=Rhodococcus sp. PSBB049 TaxID=2812863 RepID=UPI00197EAD00|nr:hypothetical protein [Rhodococcus sp. PSBB049]QSE72502.1 hypothetical protein JYA91_29780 [Rhodococcus sp. PSBB049]
MLFVDKRHLPAGRWGQALLAARGVMFDESTHKSGGAFEQCRIVDDIHYLLGVEVQASPAGCGGFHLDLMRECQSAYMPSHCRQLVASAIEAAGR